MDISPIYAFPSRASAYRILFGLSGMDHNPFQFCLCLGWRFACVLFTVFVNMVLE